MFQLHGYQTKLVQKTRQALSQGSKSVLLVSPAGSGKSVIIADIAKRTTDKGNRVMFMVHRQELVKQITETFQQEGVNPALVTIMTVGKIANRLSKLPQPQLIITDETHHSLAQTYRKIYDYYSDVPRLGFSASPWRMSGQGLKDVYETMIEGPTVKWLIDNHYLAPYDYYAPTGIDIERLKKSSTGDFSKSSMDAALGKTIFGDVVSHYKSLVNGKQAIVYSHSVEASEKVVAAFQNAGISAVHVDAKTNKSEREKVMQRFKDGHITILSNVDLISEGFNVPEVGVVIMLRPTASLVLDIQQSMRGMRYQPGKRATIIDHVGNAYRFGLPDTLREWSLEGQSKKKRGKSDAPAIRTCPNCYAVLPANTHICPLCGFEQPVESRELDVEKQAKLAKLTSEFKFTVKRPEHMDPKDAKSMDDLKKIANAHGYKPGWVYYQAKARGFISNKK